MIHLSMLSYYYSDITVKAVAFTKWNIEKKVKIASSKSSPVC